MKKDMTRAPLAFSSPSSSQQQVYTRWADCGTCSRRRLSTKIKCQAIPEEAVTIDNSTVLVVGGGGLGMEVVRSFAKAGSWVTAYQRGEKFRKEIEELGAMLAIGDVLDVGAIEKTLRGNSFDAIVCTVGRLPVRLPSQYFQINWLEEFPCLALLDFLLSSQQFSFHLHSGFLCNFLQGCFISCNFSVALLCSLQLSTRR